MRGVVVDYKMVFPMARTSDVSRPSARSFQVFLRLMSCQRWRAEGLSFIACQSSSACSDDASKYSISTVNRTQSPAGSPPDFHMWESCRTIPLVGEFSRGSPVSFTLEFRRWSILHCASRNVRCKACARLSSFCDPRQRAAATRAAPSSREDVWQVIFQRRSGGGGTRPARPRDCERFSTVATTAQGGAPQARFRARRPLPFRTFAQTDEIIFGARNSLMVRARIVVWPDELAPRQLPDSGLTNRSAKRRRAIDISSGGTEDGIPTLCSLPNSVQYSIAIYAGLEKHYWDDGRLVYGKWGRGLELIILDLVEACQQESQSRGPARLPPKRFGFNFRPGNSGFSHVGIVPDDAVGRWFSRGSPVSPSLSFRRCSILTSITLIGSQDLDVKNHPNLYTHYTDPFPRASAKWRTLNTCIRKQRRESRGSCRPICELTLRILSSELIPNSHPGHLRLGKGEEKKKNI
ncbi:hypothetical protein PR048_007877 [Dryococelus australis]|uniref:Uncharacterized protein n=1 Tax=Dryococelus australis TaxID=614101 RepID=A0ABQ9HVH7_9NEOP|nr:hypothetical protein PR048_007877 [Dryococelus australis]